MMSENYKKKFEFQKKVIARQSEQIEDYKSQIEQLKLEIAKKDEKNIEPRCLQRKMEFGSIFNKIKQKYIIDWGEIKYEGYGFRI